MFSVFFRFKLGGTFNFILFTFIKFKFGSVTKIKKYQKTNERWVKKRCSKIVDKNSKLIKEKA